MGDYFVCHRGNSVRDSIFDGSRADWFLQSVLYTVYSLNAQIQKSLFHTRETGIFFGFNGEVVFYFSNTKTLLPFV